MWKVKIVQPLWLIFLKCFFQLFACLHCLPRSFRSLFHHLPLRSMNAVYLRFWMHTQPFNLYNSNRQTQIVIYTIVVCVGAKISYFICQANGMLQWMWKLLFVRFRCALYTMKLWKKKHIEHWSCGGLARNENLLYPLAVLISHMRTILFEHVEPKYGRCAN